MTEPYNPESKAPFNMAINTLERLGETLNQIRRIEQEFMIPEATRQEMKIGLVKQFFVQASPLLLDHAAEKKALIQERVMVLEPKRLPRLVSNGTGASVVRGTKVVYDFKLDQKLDALLIEIQDTLQEGRYYMPPRRNKGRAAAEF